VSGLALAIHGLSPTVAVLLLTAGTLLIYLELNRPGSILPGALGLLSCLLSIDLLATDALAHPPTRPIPLVLLLSAIALLSLDLMRPTPIPVAVAATLALTLGLRGLLYRPDQPLATPVAVGCGLVLGISTSLLTRIARRARANKGLD
jgi:membrane-bound serine protease (ClpP class)